MVFGIWHLNKLCVYGLVVPQALPKVNSEVLRFCVVPVTCIEVVKMHLKLTYDIEISLIMATLIISEQQFCYY